MGEVLDIVIVGAGAAGLGALRWLSGASVSVRVLEARHRPGGRAWTVMHDGIPLDMGCGWLHSADRNPLVPVAEALGFTVDRSPPNWGEQAGNRGFSATEQGDYFRALSEIEARLEAAAKAGQDAPAATLFEPGSRWNPLLDAFSSFYNGAEFDTVSILDYAAYDDSGVNWRVAEGYGALVAAFADDRVTYGAPVSTVDLSGKTLRLETPQGTVEARTVIVTLPTDILAHEDMVFRPALPDKVAAAASLPLGLADKLFFAIDTPELLPEGGHVFGHIDRTATAGYHLRPFGRPYVEAFFGGRNARELETGGVRAFAASALDELAGVFGSDIRKHLAPIEATGWAHDPFARGSYSHALPGHAGARAVLAAPVEDRIFFAGEACSANWFSTAHGAYVTGVAAAEAALVALSARH